MTTVYAVASAKGGVGKTTTTATVATILAESGADVVAVDADLGMANLAGTLGVEVGETTVHDVLAGRADPADAVHEGANGLRLVPGDVDLDAYASADPSGLRGVVDAFEDADYVLLDAGAGLSHDSSLPLALADETLLVSTAERDALGDTEKTRQLAERLGGSIAGAVITRVDPDDLEPSVVAELLAAEVLGRIPEDDAVSGANRAGEPVVTFEPSAPASRAYRDLVRTLTGETISDPEGVPDPEGPEFASVGAASSVASESGVEIGNEDDVGAEADTDDGNDGGDDTDESANTQDADEATDEGTDDPEREADEDIIVADAGPVGMEEAGDEEEIIVADDTAVEGSIAGDDADESEAGVNVEDSEAEEVDDSEAEEVDDSEAEEVDDSEAGSDTDEEPGSVAVPDAEETATVETETESAGPSAELDSESDGIDEDLAGSIPFRDDDGDADETEASLNDDAGTDSSDANDGSETDNGDLDAADGDGSPDGEDDEGDEKDDEGDEKDDKKSGGFLSRLFGR